MGSKMAHLLTHSSSDVPTSHNINGNGKHSGSNRIEHEEHGIRLELVKQQDNLCRAVSEDLRRKKGRGQDISFLSTIILSLFGCSKAGLRHADDDPPISTKLKKGQSGNLAPYNSKRKFSPGRHQVSASTSFKNLLKEPLVSKDEKQKVVTGSQDSTQKDAVEHDADFKDQGHKEKKGLSKLPSLSEASSLLSEALEQCILPALPTLAQGRQWTLIYSTRKHGISLLTLYRRSSLLPGPFLLVTGDTSGAVLGGLLSAQLKPTSQKKYQGTNDTFVFTDVSGKPELYHATGVNRYFVLCTNEALAIGGGRHFALRLDNDLLTGSTGSCATFGNIPLAHSEEFTVKDVELWGFIHSSKYLPRQVSFEEPKEAPLIAGEIL